MTQNIDSRRVTRVIIGNTYSLETTSVRFSTCLAGRSKSKIVDELLQKNSNFFFDFPRFELFLFEQIRRHVHCCNSILGEAGLRKLSIKMYTTLLCNSTKHPILPSSEVRGQNVTLPNTRCHAGTIYIRKAKNMCY